MIRSFTNSFFIGFNCCFQSQSPNCCHRSDRIPSRGPGRKYPPIATLWRENLSPPVPHRILSLFSSNLDQVKPGEPGRQPCMIEQLIAGGGVSGSYMHARSTSGSGLMVSAPLDGADHWTYPPTLIIPSH